MQCCVAILALGLAVSGVRAQVDPPTRKADGDSGVRVESSDGVVEAHLVGTRFQVAF